MRHALISLALGFTVTSLSLAAEPEAAPTTVWGQRLGQLQAGLRPGSKSPCRVGDTVEWQVVVRNASNEQARVSYVPPSAFLGHLDEQRLLVSPVGIGKGFEETRTLQPGEELSFGVSLLLLAPKPAVSPARPWLEITPGKYRVSAPTVLLRRDGQNEKLGTGTMDLEVLAAPAKMP